MISIHHWQGGALKEVPDIDGACWINLAEPSTEELSRIEGLTGIPREFLTDPLDKDERPRLEIEDDILQLIIQAPYHNPKQENPIPFITIPLGIILTQSAVVTVCSRQTSVTGTFLDQIRRVCSPADQFRFVFQLLWHCAILYLRYLRDIRQRTDMVEQDLHESISNEALLRLMNIQKSLVYFTTSLKANDILLARLERMRQIEISEDNRDLLEDVEVEYHQALEMATIHNNILTGTLDAFASIISNNLNNVMKYLTSITIILMIPTLITGIYGMNVDLPLMHHSHIFAILTAASIIISFAMAFIFSRKKFL